MSPNSSINPDFYDANIVYIRYCSSDAFAGTNGNEYGWVFRGQLILKAVIADTIFSTPLPPPGQSFSILFTGCSAGGQGVVNNHRWLTDYVLTSSIASSISNLKSVSDAGWMMDITPLNPNHPSSGKQFQTAVPMWGPGAMDPDCVAANLGNEWMCFVTPYAFPYLSRARAPILIQSNQYDAFQVPWDCCSPPWKNKTYEDEAEGIRSAFHASMAALVNPPDGIFSAACFDHCLTMDDNLFTQVTVSGLSLQQAIHQWYVENRTTILIESCAGLNCSPGCSPLPKWHFLE